VVTEKGRGHEEAQNHHHRLHSVAPEKVPAQPETGDRPGWTSKFSECLVELASQDNSVVAITAAMPDVTAAFQLRFPDRHFDPGICEQHAIGLAAGLASAGMKPVVAMYSTFLQRAYDQVFHELCLQGVPVVIAADRAGLVGRDGPTHHGVFDISYLRHLPDITLMAPKDVPELRNMLEAALAWGRPCAIRFPRESVPEDFPQSSPVERGKAEILREGRDGLIVAYGAMVLRATEAARLLEKDGLDIGVVNARFAKPLDADTILGLIEKSPVTVTVEDGALAGGFGSAVLESAAARGRNAARICRLGIPDQFIEHGLREELLRVLGLDPAGIASSVKQAVQETGR
jgi:1-deoxy-D-xylulose-5-phosphate synthase